MKTFDSSWQQALTKERVVLIISINFNFSTQNEANRLVVVLINKQHKDSKSLISI